MNITLKKNLSEANRLIKTFATNTDKVFSDVVFRNSEDILRPVFNVETTDDLSQYNYCEIPYFNRKYFATIRALSYSIWEISCTVDVCSTYADGIKGSKAIVRRTQANDKINYYMNDGVFFTEQRQVVTYHTFKKNDPTTGQRINATMGTDSYYLLVAGG